MRYVVALAPVVAALALAAQGVAATTNYYGYAWLSSTTPPAGTCSGWPAGTACSGWNYWDYSQIAIQTRTQAPYGFIFKSGVQHVRWVWGPLTWTVLWSSFSGASHYNRASCGTPTTASYVQCRALIF